MIKYVYTGLLDDQYKEHMGSFPHPMHYFAAAGENDDFVIAVNNFMLDQFLWVFFNTSFLPFYRF